MPRNPDQEALFRLPEPFEGAHQVETSPAPGMWNYEVLALNRAAGTLTGRATLDETMVQGAGVVQGGTTAGVMDHSMALAVLAGLSEAQTLATVNLHVEYKRPVTPGRYTCEAEITAPGRKIIFTRAKLFNEAGKLMALASASSMVLEG